MTLCEMTKGSQDYDKFIVLGCDGSIISTEKSLPLGTEVAERKDACAVIKIQRVCGGKTVDEVIELLGGGEKDLGRSVYNDDED